MKKRHLTILLLMTFLLSLCVCAFTGAAAAADDDPSGLSDGGDTGGEGDPDTPPGGQDPDDPNGPDGPEDPDPSPQESPDPSPGDVPDPSEEPETPEATAAPVPAQSNSGGGGGGYYRSSAAAATPRPDDSALRYRIGLAEALENDGYTVRSWDAFSAALSAARSTAAGTATQAELDAAEAALAAAMDALVRPDYTALRGALAEAEELRRTDEIGALWEELFDVMAEESARLESLDQEEIDAAAARVTRQLDQLRAAIEGVTIVYKDRFVKVDVLTGEAECPLWENMALHWILPTLLGVSLAANAVLLLVAIPRRRKNQEDDVPVVSYSIEDDE